MACVAFALVACEQLLGIDQYNEVDAYPCGDACPNPDVLVADASDASDAADAFQLPDGTTAASSWARWRMDNTSAEVADGASPTSLASFVPAEGGIFDTVSNVLLWSTATITAGDVTTAAAFCSSLGGAWRLPTRIELVTLIDTTRPSAPYVTPAFDDAGPPSGKTWTSSYVRPPETQKYWFVDFDTGDVVARLPAAGGVRCVQSL